MPPGLNLAQSGVIDGVPGRTGSFAISVQVVDSTGSGIASRWLTFNISTNNNSGLFPVIIRVKAKTKKLFVYGNAFTPDSIIILNGVVLTPKSLTREGDADRLLYKGSINLGAPGTNALYVQNSNNRSAGFFF